MKLQAHTIKPAKGSKHVVKRVGRGNASGHGTSSCRGGKGQTARSGGSRGLQLKAFKRLLQSTPKLRGFNSLNTKPTEVYLDILDKKFNAGDTVDFKTLREKNLVNKNDMTAKIIARGELTKKLIVVGIETTKSVAEKIKALGGEVK